MESIVLDRHFRVWRYGIGHSQLLLHSRAGAADADYVNVLFEDVRAVKLRSSYRPLILQPAEEAMREQLIGFAGIPPLFHDRMLYVVLSDHKTEPGFVVCARVTVLTVPKDPERPDAFWPEHADPIHVLRLSPTPED
jgi:hypothetical protein